MKLSKEQERRIQQLIDKCNKYSDDSLDIYEVMNTYKCYLNASEEVRDYVYEVVADGLTIGSYNPTIYGYARCSTNESKQDIDRQVRELEELGATRENIYLEYASGKKNDRVEFNRLLDTVKPGDTIVTTEISRLTRSTKYLIEIVDIIKSKKLKLLIKGIMPIDCTNGELDPFTETFLIIMGQIGKMEADLISQRVKSGLANARSKGKTLGRPTVEKMIEKNKLPKNFIKYYEQWKNQELKKVEFARLLNISRPTLDLYIRTYEGK